MSYNRIQPQCLAKNKSSLGHSFPHLSRFYYTVKAKLPLCTNKKSYVVRIPVGIPTILSEDPHIFASISPGGCQENAFKKKKKADFFQILTNSLFTILPSHSMRSSLVQQCKNKWSLVFKLHF